MPRFGSISRRFAIRATKMTDLERRISRFLITIRVTMKVRNIVTMATSGVITLGSSEYIRYIRDSLPQTRYSLKQWNSLYREFECELCDVEREISHGGARAPFGGRVTDLHRLCSNGRYMTCVNIRTESGLRLHACNFLPLVIGTRLDVSLRYGPIHLNEWRDDDRDDDAVLSWALSIDESLASYLGRVYAFDNFWVFSSFINTDARQCHRYREQTKSTNSTVRMYIYDTTGKGHMLFVRPKDSSLYMRDKTRREVRVVDSFGNFEADESGTTTRIVVDDFVRDALVSPFDALSIKDFFLACREYMLYGVGDGDSGNATNELSRIGSRSRDIDHLDNKRISSAPALYATLML